MPWWSGRKGRELASTWPKLRDQLPYTSRRHGVTIRDMAPLCVQCNKPLVSERAEFREYRSCVNIRHAGICHECKVVTFGQHRVYPDGQVLMEYGGGWVDDTPPRTVLARLRAWLRGERKQHVVKLRSPFFL